MKINAHNRKQRRKQRQQAKENKEKGIKRGLKDPGVPASWPFREEFLKEMAFEKDRIVMGKKQKKAQNKAEAKFRFLSKRKCISRKKMRK